MLVKVRHRIQKYANNAIVFLFKGYSFGYRSHNYLKRFIIIKVRFIHILLVKDETPSGYFHSDFYSGHNSKFII